MFGIENRTNFSAVTSLPKGTRTRSPLTFIKNAYTRFFGTKTSVTKDLNCLELVNLNLKTDFQGQTSVQNQTQDPTPTTQDQAQGQTPEPVTTPTHDPVQSQTPEPVTTPTPDQGQTLIVKNQDELEIEDQDSLENRRQPWDNGLAKRAVTIEEIMQRIRQKNDGRDELEYSIKGQREYFKNSMMSPLFYR